MKLRERMTALARLDNATSPVVSLYLNTHCADEHQRERGGGISVLLQFPL
jgi:hypothetical protein